MSLISLKEITKAYNSYEVLTNIYATFLPGRIYGIAGPNGAGKSTLVKILGGFIKHYSGAMFIEGKRIEKSLNSKRALKLGIATIIQTQTILSSLTIDENIFLGREKWRDHIKISSNKHRLEEEKIERFNMIFKEFFQFSYRRVNTNKDIRELLPAEIFFISLCRCLLWLPKLIIIDEAISLLDPSLRKQVYGYLKEIASKGISSLIITHDIRELFSNCTNIIGIRDGKIIVNTEITKKSEENIVKASYDFIYRVFGGPDESKNMKQEIKESFNNKKNLIVNELKFDSDVVPISFEVKDVGILCFLSDATGKTENFFLSLLGFRKKSSGSIIINNKKLKNWNIYDLRKNRLAWIPQDPIIGTFQNLLLFENLIIQQTKNFSKYGLLLPRFFKSKVQNIIKDFNIVPPSPSTRFGQFSGGNQQKALLAREISSCPIALIAFAPTRGLDEPSRWLILKLLRDELARKVPVIYGTYSVEECKYLNSKTFQIRNDGLCEINI